MFNNFARNKAPQDTRVHLANATNEVNLMVETNGTAASIALDQVIEEVVNRTISILANKYSWGIKGDEGDPGSPVGNDNGTVENKKVPEVLTEATPNKSSVEQPVTTGQVENKTVAEPAATPAVQNQPAAVAQNAPAPVVDTTISTAVENQVADPNSYEAQAKAAIAALKSRVRRSIPVPAKEGQ